ncbi:hypothetical protein INS49_005841 [Diaporthe citri]|uniref:uncharacterized protein n=1 Tax=Diaporthe citri TaxID=83186 RepID=UPI001C7F81E1|nr:uncharacterized protein INS49_005841 [Diaporthe citri]KAG6364242.1 hypothetical protein INS49_005841 [Diaporthe citri]
MACVDDFHNFADYAELDLVEIGEAGQLGKGVFAKEDIPKYQLLGEYLGELVPADWYVDATDSYIFTIEGEFVITAKDYGNWTRFVNHHCDPNVSAAVGMYGHRRSVIFRANRDIAAGEQLCIHYGENYFSNLGINCSCDANAAPHQPVGNGDPFPWPPPTWY